MARYKVLKSVTHSVGHSFTSAMNYAERDYVMGHLLWNARATGLDHLSLDLLTGTAEPAALFTGAIRKVPKEFGKFFRHLVARQRTELRYVRAAELTLCFDLADRRPLASRPGLVASPYVCEVVVTDDRGKEYRARFRGTWSPMRPDPPVMPPPASPDGCGRTAAPGKQPEPGRGPTVFLDGPSPSLVFVTPAESLMRDGRRWLLFGGVLTGAASLLHVGIILGGPDWYRFFGAGERMARMAARGSPVPAAITAGIAAVLAVWALYALSGAGVIRRLPLLRPILALVAAVYLLRGALGVPVVLFADDPYTNQLKARMTFMVVTSVVCLGLGLCYAIGAAGVGKRAPRT